MYHKKGQSPTFYSADFERNQIILMVVKRGIDYPFFLTYIIVYTDIEWNLRVRIYLYISLVDTP